MATNSTLSAVAAFALLCPAAMADAIPPPAEHSALQMRLVGVWQEQACHNPPAMHHSEPCEIRTVALGDSSLGVISVTRLRDGTGARAVSGTWSEVSSSDNTAVVHVDIGDPDWKMSFPDKNTFVIAGYGVFPDAQFKRVGATP